MPEHIGVSSPKSFMCNRPWVRSNTKPKGRLRRKWIGPSSSGLQELHRRSGCRLHVKRNHRGRVLESEPVDQLGGEALAKLLDEVGRDAGVQSDISSGAEQLGAMPQEKGLRLDPRILSAVVILFGLRVAARVRIARRWMICQFDRPGRAFWTR